MLCRFIFLLLPAASFAGLRAQAPAGDRKVVLRSGQVIVCRIAKGCEEEMVNGKRTYSMETDGFSVKVALHLDPKVNYADVTVANGTGIKVEINPTVFRIETSEQKVTRLSYTDGATAMKAKSKAPKQEHGLPPPWYFTDPARMEEREALAAEKRSTPPLLRKSFLAPGATVVGRVYFEGLTRKNGGKKSQLSRGDATDSMSLVVPIAGSLFEFPNWPVSADSSATAGQSSSIEPETRL